MVILFVFKLSLLAKNKADDEKYVGNGWAEYEPSKNVVELTILVDLLSILLLLALVFNYAVILLSIRRLIKFLTENKLIRFLSYASVVPLSILFINKCFQMMETCWGIPAYNLNWKLYYGKVFNFDENF